MENFLITNDPNQVESIKIKLIDFGLACVYDQDNPPSEKCGTPVTMAPEIISQDFYGP